MNINANNIKVERKIKELFYKDRARVQITKISQFGLMKYLDKGLGKAFMKHSIINVIVVAGVVLKTS